MRRPGIVAGRRRHLLLVPDGAWTLLLFGVPLVFTAVVSFGSVDLVTYQTHFGWNLSNYARLLDAQYLKPVLSSLLMSITSTAACLVIGFPVALTLSRWRGRAQRILLAAVVVPLWTGFVVRTYAVVGVLGEDGPLAKFLQLFGLAGGGLHLLYSPAAVVIGMTYTYLPLMVLPLYVALERIDSSALAAASDLGAGPWSRLRRVEIPLAAPGIVAGCLLVGIPAIGEYTVPTVLGGGKTYMYGNVLATQFQEVGDYPLGSALAMTMTLTVTVVLLGVRRLTARAEELA